MKHLLLRLIPDRAGVVQDQPGLSLILHPGIPLLLQRPNDLLGVMGVHLAAKRLDIKSLAHIDEYSCCKELLSLLAPSLLLQRVINPIKIFTFRRTPT